MSYFVFCYQAYEFIGCFMMLPILTSTLLTLVQCMKIGRTDPGYVVCSIHFCLFRERIKFSDEASISDPLNSWSLSSVQSSQDSVDCLWLCSR